MDIYSIITVTTAGTTFVCKINTWKGFIIQKFPSEVLNMTTYCILLLKHVNTLFIVCMYVMHYCPMYFTSMTSSSSGQSGFTRSRRNKPQHAGANLAHFWGGPTADLHADAERLVPPLHKLSCLHRSAEEPGGASTWAIRLTHTFQKWRPT